MGFCRASNDGSIFQNISHQIQVDAHNLNFNKEKERSPILKHPHNKKARAKGGAFNLRSKK
jgi:hypothetical protein